MSLYVSHTLLRTWSDRTILTEGEACFTRGGVSDLAIDGQIVRAQITIGGMPVRTRFEVLRDGSVENHCPCRYSQEQGLVCKHVLAAGFALARLLEDPRRERAERIATRRREEERDGPALYRLRRRPPGSPGSIHALLRLRLDVDLLAGWSADAIVISCQAAYQEQKVRLDKVAPELPLALSTRDTDLLYVLEDMSGKDETPGTLTLTRELFLELLHAMAPGELAQMNEAPPIRVLDKPQLASLSVALQTDTGTLLVRHRLERDPRAYLPGRQQVWALVADALLPMEALLPDALREAYGDGSAIIPRDRVMPFLREVLPACEERFIVETTVTEDDFHFEVGQPAFVLELDGTPELLVVRLWADYGGGRVRATDRDPRALATFPQPEQPLTHVTRNAPAEAEAMAWLLSQDMLLPEGTAIKAVAGAEQILKLMADLVPAAQDHGWQVQTRGEMEKLAARADWVRPFVTIGPAPEAGWFSVRVKYQDAEGRPIAPSLVDGAVDAGRSSLTAHGRQLLANRTLLSALRMACMECMDPDGDAARGRISEVHAGYFSSILAMHPGITVTADPRWNEQVRKQTEKTGFDDVPIAEPLGSLLRPYQRTGVSWLRYLERGGFAGILADEMGLGKTIQALAWLNLERLSPSAQGRPSLVVCPTSLVHNWAREAARFTPGLRVRVVTGAGRHREWESLADHDLIVTSYALLRRDIARYQDQPFGVAILDEAQHIKNRSTQNAQAARQIRAVHRLVLTGTPMENAVTDLWSIMDFLMPGYLGAHAAFRESYERPVHAGGKAADDALQRLRCKVQPFMLRRLKSAVADDLPPRLTRVATCVMGPEQAGLYRKLVDESRDSLTALVEEKGFQASRFTVLKTLMRLRQLCCHPALLKQGVGDTAAESAKLELFFELIDEALDGGQRVLVFSQFVEMLHILRRELDARGLRHAYLDGSTRNRQEEVDRFQGDPTCPIFLISLKAGGSGLNLTGANVVIHYDPWWNPAVEDQATDRAHRIGQTRSVYGIKLVTSGTIEEQVLELQDRKRQLIDATLGGAGDSLQALTWEDVQQLLTL